MGSANLFEFSGISIIAEVPQFYRQYVLLAFLLGAALYDRVGLVARRITNNTCFQWLHSRLSAAIFTFLALGACDLWRHLNFVIYSENEIGCTDQIIIAPFIAFKPEKAKLPCGDLIESVVGYPFNLFSLIVSFVYLILVFLVGAGLRSIFYNERDRPLSAT
ncbi:MAG: hypothetical protein AAFX54_12750 [Pseudomonadota bacterium]